MRVVSLIIFFAFVVIAFSRNWDLFLSHYDKLLGLVLLHNALALGLGYFLATLFGQPPADRRAITLEVGIQNSGLGLTLLFGSSSTGTPGTVWLRPLSRTSPAVSAHPGGRS